MPEHAPGPDPRQASERIRTQARALGFDRVGFARIGPLDQEIALLREWLRRGWHAGMAYMADQVELRANPERLLPGARSVVCVALNYFNPPDAEPPGPPATAPGLATPRGRISIYARGSDYHELVRDRLHPLQRQIVREFGGAGKVCVDTVPILEKVWAARAGLGWQGKNTLLIDPEHGSYFFLGLILLTIELDSDATPVPDHCGACTACLSACPTGALVAPGQLDANRCVGYLNIEHDGPIDPALRPGMGDWIFGCDDCQTSCPWNHSATLTPLVELRARQEMVAPRLDVLLGLDPEGFNLRHQRSTIRRPRRGGFLRNVAIALGNSASPQAVPPLLKALHDGDPLVRGHAAWALGRLGGEDARHGLTQRAAIESDPAVSEEIRRALAGDG